MRFIATQKQKKTVSGWGFLRPHRGLYDAPQTSTVG